MLFLEGKLLLRHQKCNDRPFITYNCLTLQEAPQEDQISFEGPIEDSLVWHTPSKSYGSKMISLSGEVKDERQMTATPLTYDGRFIYALSMIKRNSTGASSFR